MTDSKLILARWGITEQELTELVDENPSPRGTMLNTTLLLRGEFDLLAVNCFAFGSQWRFVFAKNSDLPFSTFKKYTKAQKVQRIASPVKITWPPEPPFTESPFPLLNELLSEKKDVKIVETTEKVVEKEIVLYVKSIRKRKRT